MNKIVGLLMMLTLCLSGCAPSHFVDKKDGFLTFVLHHEAANRVQFASSADYFILHDAQQKRAGVWRIDVSARPELKYFYVVDGQTYIPECGLKEKDDFGSENCIFLF